MLVAVRPLPPPSRRGERELSVSMSFKKPIRNLLTAACDVDID